MSNRLTENALAVLESRYLLRDEEGELVETPDQMFMRVADAVAKNDKDKDRFYRIMSDLDFMPNSPTLFNAGVEKGTMSACFVLPLQDTMEGIADTIKKMLLVQKYGGGTGFSLSDLRPKGWKISSTHGNACGPVAVLKLLSAAGRMVTQGGKRDSANMAVLNVHHPDILEFISCKQVEGDIHNFNISVGVTDEFMRAVNEGEDYNLYFREDPADWDSPTVVVDTLSAKMVFDEMVEGAWRNGEPGCVFLDHANADSPIRHLGDYAATNPCFYGGTQILTEGGGYPARYLYFSGGGVNVALDARFGEGEYSCASPVYLTGKKETIEVRTVSGRLITVTPDHKMMTTEGWKAAGDLKKGDMLHTQNEGVDPFESSTPQGKQDVFDMTVEKTHSLIGSGFVISNCGEQFLLPDESCNLGSINLSHFVKRPSYRLIEWDDDDLSAMIDGRPTSDEFLPSIDWDALRDVVDSATRFLDSTIDANQYAYAELERMNKLTRRVGLGVMGFADMLVLLGIPYDTPTARRLGEELMYFIQDQASHQSLIMANEKGVCPAFEDVDGPHQRNAYLTTVAPTGTISMIAGCSSGIEPLFSLAYRKQNILGGRTLYYVDRCFERVAKSRGFYSKELISALADGVSLQDREDVPDDIKRLFVTSPDISATDHVLMQAAFQENVDNSISKTINFPNSATVEDVRGAYMLAWETDCKGITIYRAGSRDKEILTTGHTDKKEEKEELPVSTCMGAEHCNIIHQDGCMSCSSCGWSKCDI